MGRASLSLFEAVTIFNLVILLFVAYQVGKIKSEIETVFEGLAIVMTEHEKLMQRTDP